MILVSNNDNLKLIYADWLEEQGDSLGEIIRVQVALENLKEREKELLKQFPKDNILYQEGFPPRIIYKKGFAYRFSGSFLEVEEIINIHPTIQELDLSYHIPCKLITLPEYLAKLTNLKYLDISSYHFGNKIIKSLINLSNLKYLDISSNDITDSGIMKLAKSSVINNLEILKISFNHITDKGLDFLLNSKHKLVRLYGYGNRFNTNKLNEFNK